MAYCVFTRGLTRSAFELVFILHMTAGRGGAANCVCSQLGCSVDILRLQWDRPAWHGAGRSFHLPLQCNQEVRGGIVTRWGGRPYCWPSCEEKGVYNNDKKDKDHTVNKTAARMSVITIWASHITCDCVCHVCIWLATLQAHLHSATTNTQVTPPTMMWGRLQKGSLPDRTLHLPTTPMWSYGTIVKTAHHWMDHPY